GGQPAVSLKGRPKVVAGLAALAAGILLVAVSGSVAALGDTLYPAKSLAEGMTADLSTSSHILLRLRVIHPMLAVLVAGALMAAAPRLPVPERAEMGRELRYDVVGFAALQIAAGFANLLLLAPVVMQMIHLLLADVVWIAFVLLSASTLAVSDEG